MNENKTPAESPVKIKRKALYTALIAGGALLVAAAIALILAFTLPKEPGTLDEPEPVEQPDDTPSDDDDEDEEEQPGSTAVVFALPVQGGTVGTAYTFWYNSTLDRYNLHTGVDFKAPAGTSVTAAYGGRIESITDTLLEGGKVVIDHGDGLKSEYASLDVSPDLRVGGNIERGDLLGTVSAAADAMGNEYNEGEHLHFEVTLDGESVDPVAYLDLDEK